MLIDSLKNDPIISQHLCNECAENGIGVTISPTIDPQKLAIVKVDDFYNKNVHPQPKSPDCLVIQHCTSNRYNVYIIELRDIDSPDGFTVKEIETKFINCLDDFMSRRYGNHFHDMNYSFDSIHLLFISDPYGFKYNPDKQLKMRGHKLDLLMAVRIPKFFNKHLYIAHRLPDPQINNCSNNA